MQENLRNSDIGQVERIVEANQRSTVVVGSIGQVAEEVLRGKSLPKATISAIEYNVGRAIKTVVQNHMDVFLRGETSARGMRIDMGIRAGVRLDIDSGQLYNVRRSERELKPVEPLPDQEWFRNWRDILDQVICLRYY